MSEQLLLVGVLTVFASVVIAFVVISSWAGERRSIYRTIRTVKPVEMTADDIRQRELAVPALQRVFMPAIKRLTGGARRLTPSTVTDRLRKDLELAGNPPNWDAERLLSMKLVAVIIFPVAFGILFAAAGIRGGRLLVLLVLLAAVGYYLPEWLIRGQSSSRQDRIRKQLPDALDLLAITVRAGLGFDSALTRVANEIGDPLGGEFQRVLHEMQLGKSRSDGLRALGERSDVPELKSFVLAMVQADIFGISIGKVLEVQAEEMRIKRRQRAEEQAQKVPVKIVFPVVLCIFPSLFVVLLGPAAITIYTEVFSRTGS